MIIKVRNVRPLDNDQVSSKVISLDMATPLTHEISPWDIPMDIGKVISRDR